MSDALASQIRQAMGDLSLGAEMTAADLQTAQIAVAAALSGGVHGDLLTRRAATWQPEPGLAAQEGMAAIAAGISELQLPPQTVARREFPTSVSPDPTVGATHATGRAVTSTHGPFVDTFGRPVWLDVFHLVRLVGIQRSGGVSPFLYVEVPYGSGSATSLKLGPGSVWIDAEQLAPGAPSSSFAGLRIKHGTVKLGGSVSVSSSPIVIPAGATISLSIDLDPASPPDGSGPGPDARNAAVGVPASATFTFGPGGGRLEHAGAASLHALGFEIALTYEPAAGVFEPLMGRITLPMACDARAVTMSDSRSTLVTLNGSAPIDQAGWSLPLTVASPASLSAAAGAGGIGLELAPGLSMTWVGHDSDTATGPTSMFVEPGALGLAGSGARSPGRAAPINLWQAGPAHRGGLDIRWPKPFPFRFVSQAAGSEAFGFVAHFSARLDQPRTVNNERVGFSTQAGVVTIIQTAGGNFFVAEGAAAQQARLSAQSYAIKNLLLKTSTPLVLVVFGALTETGVAPGLLGLVLDLLYLLPILPDPYAANVAFEPRQLRKAIGLGALAMVLRWPRAKAPTIDLLLPANALALTSRLPTPRASEPLNDAAVVDAEVVERLQARMANVGIVGDGAISLLDLSTNVSLFGVSFLPNGVNSRTAAMVEPAAATVMAQPGTAATPAAQPAQLTAMRLGPTTPPVTVADLMFEARGMGVHVFTLPAVQWEPVLTPDQSTPFPTPLTFADCGGPTVIATDTVDLVPVAPRPAIDALLTGYNTADAPPRVAVRFTLPFGIVALAELARSDDVFFPGPSLEEVTPVFTNAGLIGGDQLSIRAAEPLVIPLGGDRASPSLPGWAVQLHNARIHAVPTVTTVLTPIDDSFNANFGPTAPYSRVPVTRLDISGFGESLFSDWRNPADAAALISKARFDVLVGRASLEIVQAYSVLYPYAVRVVRTITIQRQNGAVMVRHDSGWQPVSDGIYRFPKPDLITHPGVVGGVNGVHNIRDTGQRYTTSDGSELMAVRFDCHVSMENVVLGGGAQGVPGRDQLGYVQLTDPGGYGQLAPDQYAELLAAVGSLGGSIDCVVNITGSGQRMRVARVGVAATPGMGGPEFAMAAWGSPIFPGGGQWSVLRQTSAADAPQPVAGDQGVPLVRAGPAGSPPPPSSPYRFADPIDTLRPDAPASDYGIVHATGTQRTFFPRPKIDAGAHIITSTRPPLIADPFVLATAVGLFPKPDGCIPFPDAAYGLVIGAGGNFTLQRGSPNFTTAPIKRVIREAQASRAVAYCADEHGNPSVVTLVIDTAAVVPWSLSITNLSVASESGSLGEVTRIVGTVSGSAAAPTNLTDSRFVFGPCLQPVAALVSFLEKFSPLPPLIVSMSNPWQLQVGLKFDFEKLLEQVPPLKAFLEQFIVDLDVIMAWMETATSQNMVTTFEITIKVPTPFPPVVGIGLAKVKFQMGDDGNAWTFQLGVGIGVSFKVGPFGVLAYFAESQFLIAGDNVFGLGMSALIKGSVDLGVVEVDISVEAKIALLKVTCGADTTIWGVAQVTFAFEVTIAFVIDIEFDAQAEEDQNIDGGPCPLPNVV
jgi:hypothetical protein